MRLRKLTLALAVLFSVWAFADNFVTITFTDGTTTEKQVNTKTETLSFNEAMDSLLFSDGTAYSFAEIDHIGFRYAETEVDPSDDPSVVYITWNGTAAPTIQCSAPGVTAEVNGGDVTLTNTNTDTEYTYVLSGNSTAGSLTLVSDYKSTIKLNGVDLQSDLEEALNIKCGKRVALELVEGTTNTLADCTTDNGQKAALYCKGHLEVSGAGTLNLTGNIKHGISTKEYCQLKKTVGTINILKATGDGIHAGQYFQMNGGNVTISGVGGDGIQAEVTDDETDEDNGQMIIKGGTLNITTTANDVAALKSDSLMTINDGEITLKCTGNGSKGLKSDNDIEVNGGTMNITNGGGLYEDTDEEEETTEETANSYKVYVSIPTSSNGGGGGWGGGGPGGGGQSNAWTTVALYKEDGTLVANLSSTVSITSGYTTTSFYYYDFKEADSGTYYFKSADYTSQGGGWGGGSGTTYTIKSANISGPTSGEDVYYSITNSYTTSGTTRTYSINNVTSTYAGGTSTSEGDLSSSHGIKGDNSVVINGGDITITMTGTAGKAISSDYDITMNDGTLNITNSGAGQTSGSTNYTAKGFTADRNVYLVGGDITIKMSGSGGKGVKADNNLYVGDSATGNGPTLTVSTTGSSLGSSSTGGGGGWGGQESSSGSSAKAIKAMLNAYIYGGKLNVSTTTSGAEGLEAKSGVYIEGGQNYFKCYDDCINSNGCIYFNGGTTICYGYGNDAVDSNAGKTGAITIGNGNIFAFSTKGSPEEGIDCDNNSYIQITGTGIAISAGASQGGSSSSSISNASQGYAFVTSNISYSSGRYYTLSDASGNNLATYSFPTSCSSSLALFTAKGMVKGSTYYVKYSTTKPTDATTVVGGDSGQAGFYIGSTATGTSSVTSFTAK